MTSENETFADAIDAERRRIECAKADAEEDLEIECVFTDEEVGEIIDRIESAHRHEVDSLNFKLMTAKSEQKTAANVIIEQTNKIEKLEAQVAEFREFLKEAVHNECNFCRTVRKDGTYGKCEHLLESGGCDNLRGVTCVVHRWRKALEMEEK